jgi:hypothetical protein
VKKWISFVIVFVCINLFAICTVHAQWRTLRTPNPTVWVEACVYKGDTIPFVQLRNTYVFPPLKFTTPKQWSEYYRLVRNIKLVMPYAIMINNIIVETYEYVQTIPDPKRREAHLRLVEKGLMAQYKEPFKKMSYTQGKLLIKIIDRECNQSSYEIIKAFMGRMRAGFYQGFAKIFGASLKKEYNPFGDDAITERVITLVMNGQL